MTPATSREIFAGKKARRRRLASLPIDQKVDLIEQLHELGLTMVNSRESLQKPSTGRGGR